MKPPLFPFAALVGLDPLKLALQLAAIDFRLSVLIRGDKGGGKSTAARGLAGLLKSDAPFVTLPIGTTEDRLLGGLDIERTLSGKPALKAGLVAQADGGVLYIDEVNLLADHLADALLDGVASGVHVVEREGFSASQATEFVLLGSMNPEEGSLRPQLLDRFALVVDVLAPTDPTLRCDVLDRRLSYDQDPVAFEKAWVEDQTAIRTRLSAARDRVKAIGVSRDILLYVATRIAEHSVRSLRADLAVVRASRAYAALDGVDIVTREHVEAVLPLALAHRMPPGAKAPPERPPAPSLAPDRSDTRTSETDAPAERVFALAERPMPRLVIDNEAPSSGLLRTDSAGRVGPIRGTRQTVEPRELDVRASVLHAATRGGSASLTPEDLHERLRSAESSTRFVFVVDSSGSHAVHERMRAVKGAVTGLLATSHQRRDDVVLISCRGAAAQVLMEPTTSREEAERALEYLPTGGRTPLAHALELTARYVTDHTLVVIVTDGHANVPTQSDDAWADAQSAGKSLGCAALVVDTEDISTATGRPKELAVVIGAQYIRLEDLDASLVLRVARPLS